MNILHIDSSILGEASASRTLTREIVGALRAQQPQARVTYTDLAAEPLPHLSLRSISGADAQEAARNEATLEAFLAADVIVIGTPLYNFSVPTQLKAWIDRIVVKERTFRYTAQGPQGLVQGKTVIVASARGGIYEPGAGTEFAESYLKLMFAFLGISDVRFVRAEGLNISTAARERALAEARLSIGPLTAPPAALAA